MPQAMTPDELFELTARYHDLGEHRTGTPADLSTAEWFFGHLADLGASVHRRHVAFDRYDAQAVLVDADGEPIPSEAVYYEFLGHFDGTGLRVARASQRGSGNASAFDPLLVDRDEPLVIVIEDGPPGHVVMPNRAIGAGNRPPAVVVPSDAADRLGGATLAVGAKLVPGRCEASAAVVGEGPPVTVTTPLSGWFGCASERGSGAAIALDLVARLAESHTVTVVACSGHELDHLGLHSWLERAAAHGRVPTGPVIHLGASIAAAHLGELEPRFVLHDREAPSEWLAELTTAVTPANYHVVGPDDPWPGEGRNWRPHTRNVLSFTGAGRWFHTTGDTPDQATTPAALGLARDAVWAATRSLLGRVG